MTGPPAAMADRVNAQTGTKKTESRPDRSVVTAKTGKKGLAGRMSSGRFMKTRAMAIVLAGLRTAGRGRR